MRKDVPLAVEVPSPERDKPAWVKVGVIAAVGFIVGIAWPRLVGVRLGPSAPGESSAAASASGATGGRAADAPPTSGAAAKTNANGTASAMASATAAAATTPTAAAVLLPPKIIVTKGTVVSCKTTDGEKKTGKECGPVAGLDMLVRDKVKGIAGCGGVEGQTGKFSLTANADFKSGRFWYEVNKGATVQNLDAITSCLKTGFHGQAVTNVPHEHPRYTVSYTAVLSAAEKEETAAAVNKAKTAKDENKTEKTEKVEKPETPVDENKPAPAVAGEANVAWEVALVRDAPKVGAVVARLPRGTKVKLGAMKDGWYSVKFGDDFGTDGWVYRGAVGR
jgi:hypothetical protein